MSGIGFMMIVVRNMVDRDDSGEGRSWQCIGIRRGKSSTRNLCGICISKVRECIRVDTSPGSKGEIGINDFELKAEERVRFKREGVARWHEVCHVVLTKQFVFLCSGFNGSFSLLK